MVDMEEIFKGAIALIFGVIFLSALADIIGKSPLAGDYSFLIGFAFLAIMIAVLLKILEAFGGRF